MMLLESGTDLVTIKELLGHTFITTTLKYVYSCAEDKIKATFRLNNNLSFIKNINNEKGIELWKNVLYVEN